MFTWQRQLKGETTTEAHKTILLHFPFSFFFFQRRMPERVLTKPLMFYWSKQPSDGWMSSHRLINDGSTCVRQCVQIVAIRLNVEQLLHPVFFLLPVCPSSTPLLSTPPPSDSGSFEGGVRTHSWQSSGWGLILIFVPIKHAKAQSCRWLQTMYDIKTGKSSTLKLLL